MKQSKTLILSVAFLSGCAMTTTMLDYKPISVEEPYGYEDTLQEDGTYVVKVVLPAFGTNKDLPFEFWEQRANELCGENNFDKNIYKAVRPTVSTQGGYVYGGVGTGGGSAGDFILEGTVTCKADSP